MLPVLFVSHGAPTLAIDVGNPTHSFLQSLPALVGRSPRAVAVISAHWEDDAFALTATSRPETIHDFHGFPAALYDIRYPAPGEPALAARAAELINAAGLPSRMDERRGLDHGAWVPLCLAWPDANLPVVQISLRRGLDAREHIRLGCALAPMRNEGVLIVGSGGAVHNLRELDWHGTSATAESWAVDFREWLETTLALPDAERQARLADWQSAPTARRAHPREEHLLPLHVAAAAAGDDAAALLHDSWQLGSLSMAAWRFGA
jgi:4,5-DOPA dioxygenase extradiol